MSSPCDSRTEHRRYPRRLALVEGELIDATLGEFARVTREYFPDHRLAMTSAVFALICGRENAVADGDLAAHWHDILRMSRVCPVRLVPGGHTFEVGFRHSGIQRRHELKILFHDGPNGEHCASVMLTDEG